MAISPFNVPDIAFKVGSFLPPGDAASLTHLNKQMQTKSFPFLRNKYLETFGELNGVPNPDTKTIKRLLYCADKQPNAAVNHNVHKAPKSLLERWKWMCGVKNSLDEEVQSNYNNSIRSLENSQATSIIQLQNLMRAFWNSDRQIKDCERFRQDEKTKATNGTISKIFFTCLEFLFTLWYKSSTLYTGRALETRSRATYAKIGAFAAANENYDVVAFHVLGDERSFQDFREYKDATERQFHSITYGGTYIGIFKRAQNYSLETLGHYGANPNFRVMIGREKQQKDHFSDGLSCEGSPSQGVDAVFRSKRHLLIGNHLEYRGRTNDPHGSDRSLDQKLTQLMVEIAKQNDTISVRVTSNHDDLPVLVAAGFSGRWTEYTMDGINVFRAVKDNKLYPPYHDYSSIEMQISTESFKEKQVYYSRGAAKSWDEITQESPILRPGAGRLPEYWAQKPNIVEG